MYSQYEISAKPALPACYREVCCRTLSRPSSVPQKFSLQPAAVVHTHCPLSSDVDSTKKEYSVPVQEIANYLCRLCIAFLPVPRQYR